MRSYGDLCGIARALDIVGERWALLIVRELLFGPKRFADLVRGLSGISQNVLTQRLRDLEQGGVLTRRRPLPPAAGVVYELTKRGRGLEPVLLALGRWGSPLERGPESSTELSPDALLVALRTTFDETRTQGLRNTVRLQLPGDAFRVTVDGAELDVIRSDGPADATLTCAVRTMQDLVFDGRDLEDAVRSGDVRVEGDQKIVHRFLTAFDDGRERRSRPGSA